MGKFKIGILVVLLALILLFLPLIPLPFQPLPLYRAMELTTEGRLIAREIEKESEKTEPLDVLFLARSSMQSNINAAEVERRLSKDGKSVRIFIAGFSANDMYSSLKILESFLSNRKVANVIISDDFLFTPPQLISALTLSGKDLDAVNRRMTFREKIVLYQLRLASLPVIFRELVFPLNFSPNENELRQIQEFIESRGTIFQEGRLASSQEKPEIIRSNLLGKALSLSEVLKRESDEKTKPQFFSSSFSEYFLKRSINLVRDKGGRLYLMRDILIDRPPGSSVILFGEEGEDLEWNYRFKGTISIPMERIFNGVEQKDLGWYFSSAKNLNRDGNTLLTDAITPVIRDVIVRE